MILKTENLGKAFGGLMAVHSVNLEVQEGELSAIIGPNGAGKSTLFNLITGHLRPSAGKIFFKGEDITNSPPFRICQKKIGRSFQKTNIFPRLSVFENIQVAVLSEKRKAMDIHSQAEKMCKHETKEILERIRMVDKANRLAGSLSYGDQRWIEVGIALANRPELLLLDECTAGMTPEETIRTCELIVRLAREMGLTILFIEHDMNVVFGISQLIRVMHLGKIIVEGDGDEIKNNDEVRRIYLGEEE